jgi:hypothetical protein
MGIIVSKAWPAYRVCEGIETLSAEENAATVGRQGNGLGREGDGHGIWIQLCAVSVAGGGDFLGCGVYGGSMRAAKDLGVSGSVIARFRGKLPQLPCGIPYRSPSG